jgi:hypothetical protein
VHVLWATFQLLSQFAGVLHGDYSISTHLYQLAVNIDGWENICLTEIEPRLELLHVIEFSKSLPLHIQLPHE